MNIVRQIYKKLPERIKTPAVLKNRHVEVIMMPLDEETELKSRKNLNQTDEFIGKWEGEPLIRQEQGDFENRESMK